MVGKFAQQLSEEEREWERLLVTSWFQCQEAWIYDCAPTRENQIDLRICINFTLVWQLLKACSTSHTDLIKQDVLRAALSSFILPKNCYSFQKLTNITHTQAPGLRPLTFAQRHTVRSELVPVKQLVSDKQDTVFKNQVEKKDSGCGHIVQRILECDYD
ncbi:unnamed protein product [Pleuronectes platessa]|uniref:Uncharacterized protein n=1 Tax=Pleuronectes platessa TaxID=8262 RepID=A0A9N7YLS0_PLEPL|nr:unnamed protein product [Pleuronectes platessa]